MINNSFYSNSELQTLGFKSIGSNVLVSRFARFYSIKDIELGSNVRIDDFCILSGNIKIGNYVHISAYCALYGRYGIEMESFTGLSPRCTVFSASDDFSGEYLIGPLVDEKYTNVLGGKVYIKKYSQMGSGCTILPNVVIGEGVAVGAMSLITGTLPDWGIYCGIPAKFLKERMKNVEKLEVDFLKKNIIQ